MKHTVFGKNLQSTALLLLLSIFLLGSVFSGWSYRFTVKTQRAELNEVAEKITHAVSSLLEENSLTGPEIDLVTSIMGDTSHYGIMLADESGIVVACSDGMTCDHIGTVLLTEVTKTVNESGTYHGVSDMGGLFTERHYVTVLPLYSASKADFLGYVLVSSIPAEMSAPWRASSGKLLLVALFVAVIALLISYLNARHTTQPINEMTRVVDSFARGDFSARVDLDSEDEVGRLADSFNLMADSLESSEKRRREFIANISHELKTPMTTISGFADGILDGTIPPESEKEYLSVISSETHRLSRLVRDMLDVSQLTAKDPSAVRSQSFELIELVTRTLLSLEKKITDRGLDVDADFPVDSITVLGDRDAITQVVYNLLDNAAKFADEGSVLRMAIWKQNGRAYVSIEDTGATIPEAELPLIFDRFHKTDKSRSLDKDGYGLGLYIVKTILDNHREDIFVTSADGVTKFTFTLTIASQK